jgi:hypothetical protein
MKFREIPRRAQGLADGSSQTDRKSGVDLGVSLHLQDEIVRPVVDCPDDLPGLEGLVDHQVGHDATESIRDLPQDHRPQTRIEGAVVDAADQVGERFVRLHGFPQS